MHNQSSIQINIPNPCTEDWERMTPKEQGRFCAHCQKCIKDFTDYSDAALYQFFSKNIDHVCGRFHVSQLNRNISVPPQPHSRLYRLFIGLGLVLVFTQAPDVYARRLPSVVIENAFYAAEGDSAPGDSVQIKGHVFNRKKKPIVDVIIWVMEDDHDFIKSARTDSNGNFSLSLPPGFNPENTFLIFSTDRYGRQTIVLTGENINKPFMVKMELLPKNWWNRRFITGEIIYKVPLIDPWEPEKRTITSDKDEML